MELYDGFWIVIAFCYKAAGPMNAQNSKMSYPGHFANVQKFIIDPRYQCQYHLCLRPRRRWCSRPFAYSNVVELKTMLAACLHKSEEKAYHS